MMLVVIEKHKVIKYFFGFFVCLLWQDSELSAVGKKVNHHLSSNSSSGVFSLSGVYEWGDPDAEHSGCIFNQWPCCFRRLISCVPRESQEKACWPMALWAELEHCNRNMKYNTPDHFFFFSSIRLCTESDPGIPIVTHDNGCWRCLCIFLNCRDMIWVQFILQCWDEAAWSSFPYL